MSLLQESSKSSQASKRLRGPKGRFLSTEEIESTFATEANWGDETKNTDNGQVGALWQQHSTIIYPLGQAVGQSSGSEVTTHDTSAIEDGEGAFFDMHKASRSDQHGKAILDGHEHG